MKRELRINHWAALVVKVDQIDKNPMVPVIQSKEIQTGLITAKTMLTSIYNTVWGSKNIGYPNTVEIMESWRAAPMDIALEEDDVPGMLANIRLMIMSIDVDMAACEIAFDQAQQAPL